MNEKVMQLVNEICNTKSNCRGIENNQEHIIGLLKLKGIEISNIIIKEVPLNWNKQVVILYQNITTNEHRELFAGMGTDGNFYFEDQTDEDADMYK